MVDVVHMRKMMCVMAVSVTHGAHTVSPQLWVLSRSSGTLGILCREVKFINVQGVGLFYTSLRMVVTPIPTSLLSSHSLVSYWGWVY